jgi:hypothetical protein
MFWLAAFTVLSDFVGFWRNPDFWASLSLAGLAGTVLLAGFVMLWRMMEGLDGEERDRSGGTVPHKAAPDQVLSHHQRYKTTMAIVTGLASANLLLRLVWPSQQVLLAGAVLSLAALFFAARNMASVLRAKSKAGNAGDPPTRVY